MSHADLNASLRQARKNLTKDQLIDDLEDLQRRRDDLFQRIHQLERHARKARVALLLTHPILQELHQSRFSDEYGENTCRGCDLCQVILPTLQEALGEAVWADPMPDSLPPSTMNPPGELTPE